MFFFQSFSIYSWDIVPISTQDLCLTNYQIQNQPTHLTHLTPAINAIPPPSSCLAHHPYEASPAQCWATVPWGAAPAPRPPGRSRHWRPRGRWRSSSVLSRLWKSKAPGEVYGVAPAWPRRIVIWPMIFFPKPSDDRLNPKRNPMYFLASYQYGFHHIPTGNSPG